MKNNSLKLKLLLPFCFLALNLLSCSLVKKESPVAGDSFGDAKKGEQKSETEQTSSDEVVSADVEMPTADLVKEVFFQVESLSEPTSYRAHFVWSPSAKKIHIRNFDTILYEGDNLNQFDYPLKENSDYEFTIVCFDNPEQPETIGVFKGKTPKDLVVNGHISLSGPTEWQADRIFFAKNTHIVTQGFPLTIISKELFSHTTRIESYHPNQRAPNHHAGRPGGLVRIKSLKARGDMDLLMRGEHGGHGNPGPSWDHRAPKGGKGKGGSREPNELFDRGPRPDMYFRSYICNAPGNGAPGHAGNKGHQGGAASRGGDSGVAIVDIMDHQGFNFHFERIAGEPGTPGPGGPGQQGGEGGDPGDPASGCGMGKAGLGPEGPTGPQGDPGNPAPPGNLEESCIYAERGVGNCSF